MNPKERAARAALKHVHSGMVLGLGTGSTAKVFIDLLGAEIAAGRLNDIRGVPTSVQSDEQAKSLGITLVDFTHVHGCDLTIDGADEIAPSLALIKGLGGALLREKVVAQNSKHVIIIADESKVVPHLGAKSPLPVEVAVFARATSERFLATFGCRPILRMTGGGQPFITDNGNYIFDCAFDHHADGIARPGEVDTRMRSRAGIVETGLFVGIAHLAIVGGDDGVREIAPGG